MSRIMPSDFLELAGRHVLVLGVANRKSVAWHVARVLTEAGARVIYGVRSSQRADDVRALAGADAPVIVCDVEKPEEIQQLRDEVAATCGTLHGLVHSIAFADYSAGWLPFHETPRAAFLQAI
ncbi:MAG: SDR family oxidoreductase, partial [Planctomycetaceae bacterium]